MKKIQCPNILVGENVHKHFCICCGGKQHIPFATVLKYQLGSLCVLTDDGREDASDYEMHSRIERTIVEYVNEYQYKGEVKFERIECGEPIATLNSCINSLIFLEMPK